MRINPLYAPDGMMGTSGSAERFDDGLVHNHHWAVSDAKAYPSQGEASVTEYRRSAGFFEASPFQSAGTIVLTHDHHDDGLVHNHHWAVSGK